MFFTVTHPPGIYLSNNWAGSQVNTGQRVITQASATFRVPMSPRNGPNQAEMSYWVGVGANHNLCQAGVADTRVNGQFQTGLIAQDYPAPPHVKTVVRPGDWITATAGKVGTRYEATVTDTTNHKSLTIGCRMPSQGAWSQAEWIAESKVSADGQPVLVSQPVTFQYMATQIQHGAPYQWTLWMGPATWPTINRLGNAVVSFW